MSQNAAVIEAPVRPAGTDNNATQQHRRREPHRVTGRIRYPQQGGGRDGGPGLQISGRFVPHSAIKTRLLTTLTNRLAEISNDTEGDRTAALHKLANGDSPNGFVDTPTGDRVASVAALQALIEALERPKYGTVVDRDFSLVYYYVPAGWTAYAGEVHVKQMVETYAARDAALASTNGSPAPEVGTGPWVQRLGQGTHVEFREVTFQDVHTGKTRTEVVSHLVNKNVPRRETPEIAFLIDNRTNTLAGWQPGKFMGKLPAGHRARYVTLASEEVTDEPWAAMSGVPADSHQA